MNSSIHQHSPARGQQPYLSAAAVPFPQHMNMKYQHNPGAAIEWFGPMSHLEYEEPQQGAQGLIYEHMSMGSHPHRRPGTLYMSSPRVALENGYAGCVTLTVACLPTNADVALLHDLFAPYGRILSAEIQVDSNPPNSTSRGGLCTGKGKVQIEGIAQAQLATQALNGAIIFEGVSPLMVSMTANSFK